MKNLKIKPLIIFLIIIFSGCVSKNNNAIPTTNVLHPQWTENAVLYEVNVRQFTEEGTFAAFDTHLQRLSELGVDILWFMPIHPIGVVERKGELGSYYSVKDYKDINPEYGTLKDFATTVEKAHNMGFKVIIDWVANHTSRDHSWINEHPEWYVKDSLGVIVAPFDWSDVAKLDYTNNEMRSAMVDAMRFWVKEYGIDGFRCDVAEQVPVDFWDMAVAELRKERGDLFFLAEAENPTLNVNAFDAYYGWENHHMMNQLAQSKIGAKEYRKFLDNHSQKFPFASIAMNFTSNHDENSWNGTEFERMGDAVREFAALTFALPGIPMIYSGQEVGLNKRLEFFKRDPISWEDNLSFTVFYKELIAIRDAHPSMYAPIAGAPLKIIETTMPEKIFAFERSLENDSFKAFFNFSKEQVDFKFGETSYTLPPFGYLFVF